MYTILNFPTVSDKRGSLTYINNIEQIPFEIKRVFMVTDVPEGMTRGGHAHKNLQEVLIPLNGSFCVEVTDGKNCSEICLSSENSGILVPPSTWRVLSKFSPGAICLSLCSEKFDDNDYIMNWEGYLSYHGQ